MKTFVILFLLLISCSQDQRQPPPKFDGTQAPHTMLDRYTMDTLETTYRTYAKLTVALANNGGPKDKLVAADQATYQHLVATRYAFDHHDIKAYEREIALTRAAMKETLKYADLGEKK